jgi:uncharacterized protein (DUF1330 family)
MPAYLIAGLDEVKDAAGFEEYRVKVGPMIDRYGGRYLAAGPAQHAEGDWRPGVIALIEFPSMERLLEWYDSAEYQPLKELRMRSTRGSLAFMESM